MTPISFHASSLLPANAQPLSQKPAAAASGQAADDLQLSPIALAEAGLTGRVTLDEHAGNLSGDQAQQLYGQISAIHSQIVADRQADGGTLTPADAQAIQQSQSQLGQTVYSDAHGGAAPPAGATASPAAERQAMLTGRIVLNQQAGNLNSQQAGELGTQVGTIQQQIAADLQADGGTLNSSDAQAINQMQNQLSQQIRDTAHDVWTPLAPVTNPV